MRFPSINWTALAEAWAPLAPTGVYFSPDGAIYGPDGTLIAPARSSEQSRARRVADGERLRLNPQPRTGATLTAA